MKIKTLIIFGLVTIASFLFIRHPAYAHFPSTDKNIVAILHVDPEDEPIPGQPATLYFDFGDITNKFTLAECDCTLSVSEQGKNIFTQKLIAKKLSNPSIYNAGVPFIFPDRDIYHITLVGKPMTSDAFQSFTVSWDFRVDQYPLVSINKYSISFLNILVYGITGIGVILLIGTFIRQVLLDTRKKK